MSVNTKPVSTSQTRRLAGDSQVSEAQQVVQHNLLAELPGLIFGLLTLVYVVSSLWLRG